MTGLSPHYWNREALEMVGRAVRLARLRASMSQRVLAARSGVAQTTISRLERGVVPGMGMERFARIAMVLASDLFSERLFPADDLPLAMHSPLFRHGLVAGFGTGRGEAPSGLTDEAPWARRSGEAPRGLTDEAPWARRSGEAPSGLTDEAPAVQVSPPEWWMRRERG